MKQVEQEELYGAERGDWTKQGETDCKKRRKKRRMIDRRHEEGPERARAG